MSHNELDHRHYVIIDVSEISNLDFSELMETSEDTLRVSNDGTKTFVKYTHNSPDSPHTPSCLEDCVSKSEEYSHEDFLEILSGPEWNVDFGGGLHGS
tara:strand:+ start:13243 stop:13536 length:294 start_codon:yes stop_codon:yes gene_type:complete